MTASELSESAAWAAIAGERRALADVLDDLTPEQWATASLCAGWTVQDVVAHLMAGPAGKTSDFLKAMLRARGRFHVANRLLATQRSALGPDRLIADLRTQAESHFSPPGYDWHAPLTDLMLHRLDILVPLGLTQAPADDVWPSVLGFLVSSRARAAFTGRRLPDLTYRATDVDWTSGSGAVVEAAAADLALAITGRPVQVGSLNGPGASSLVPAHVDDQSPE